MTLLQLSCSLTCLMALKTGAPKKGASVHDPEIGNISCIFLIFTQKKDANLFALNRQDYGANALQRNSRSFLELPLFSVMRGIIEPPCQYKRNGYTKQFVEPGSIELCLGHIH